MVKYMNTSSARRATRVSQTDRIFRALGTPIRRNMIERLSRHGRMPLSEVARPYGISLPAALKHMHILERGGFVRHEKLGRARFFSVDRNGFDAAEQWLQSQRAYWEGSFNRLEALLNKRKK
ncbi:MAG TPA: helix-turn-helix domain-containing protein [Candidatus Paceibacterota bacterium]|nr:helix-turn-helix domain-containing protein [Candidatus Paceibacterota bacterium]